MSKRSAGLLFAALLVLALGILSFAISQVPAFRLPPTAVPTRTARPTWTSAPGGFVVATPTLDATRFPEQQVGRAPQAVPTSQLVVPGQPQALVVPQGNGAPGGVMTVVIVLVTATPVPTDTPAAAEGTASLQTPGTPQPPSTPGRPAATPTVSNTPPPPVVVHVTQADVYVRTGPGVSYPPATKLDKDTTVTVVGRNRAGDWWKICCVNGGDVWIADSVVKVEGPLWTVAEVTNIPPAPTPTFTPAPPPTPAPTPTFAWPFRLEGAVKQYPLNQPYFRVVAVIYDGATPLYGYKLRIRKLSTGQEWLTNGSDAFWTYETIEWSASSKTPNVGAKRNVKWDGNAVTEPLDGGVWDVTVTDGGGKPISAPVQIEAASSDTKWYYLVFTGRSK